MLMTKVEYMVLVETRKMGILLKGVMDYLRFAKGKHNYFL